MLKPKSKPVNYFLVIVIILIAAAITMRIMFPPNDLRKEIEILQKTQGPKFDSLTARLASKNRFFDSIRYLISSGKLIAAENIIDQLLNKEPRNDYYLTLKGEIFSKRKQYDSALYYYNYALIINPNSGATVEKAKLFIECKQYPRAIEEYKKAFDNNYDFSYLLAKSFELNKQNDSAIKYYQIYLDHYPDSLFQQLKYQGIYIYPPDSVRIKIKKLEK